MDILEYGHEFDFLFIQFYNNYCYPGGQYFLSVMDTWLNWARSIPNGPLIVLGLPAGPKAAGKPHYYFPPDKLASVYKVTMKETSVRNSRTKRFTNRLNRLTHSRLRENYVTCESRLIFSDLGSRVTGIYLCRAKS